MNAAPDFFWSYLPFHVVNYGLAIVLWSCVGRFMLAWFVPALQPTNYIWRGFVALTDWAVNAIAVITPRYIRPIFLPLLTAFWILIFRMPLFELMRAAGMTPSLQAG
jgi:hypothetical protein